MSLVSGIYGLREIGHAIKPIRLARYVIPALIGLPFGMALLALTNVLILKIIIGCLLILFGVYSILR
ncbi:MAG: sulfite exporter TauE/SafE family protein, partial [Candidatus Puniceispirillales bacterium]